MFCVERYCKLYYACWELAPFQLRMRKTKYACCCYVLTHKVTRCGRQFSASFLTTLSLEPEKAELGHQNLFGRRMGLFSLYV